MDEKLKELKLQLMQTHGFTKKSMHPQQRKNIRKEIAKLKTKEKELIIKHAKAGG